MNNAQGGGAGAASGVDGAGDDANTGPVMHTITFYRNGIFTVDDGEPRNVQDPANKDFIDSIGRGEVPREFDVDELRDVLKVRTPSPQHHPKPSPKRIRMIKEMSLSIMERVEAMGRPLARSSFRGARRYPRLDPIGFSDPCCFRLAYSAGAAAWSVHP